MNLQGIRSSVSLLGSQYSQYKERKRERERNRLQNPCRRFKKRRNWIPSYVIAFEIAEGVDRDSEREIVQGRKRVHFQRIRARFPRKWIHGNVGGNTISVSDLWIFFSCSPFPVSRKEGKRERVEGIFQLVLQLLVSWSVLAFLSSLFEMFFFISSFIVLLKSEMYK